MENCSYERVPTEEADENEFKQENNEIQDIHSQTLDSLIGSLHRVQNMSLAISNEIDIQNKKARDLEAQRELQELEEDEITLGSERVSRRAQREECAWTIICIIIAIAVTVALLVKLRKRGDLR
ncbi:hypothetical protein EON65_32990 [archaeon]|nr:MAG: hypothetical protein EON65_32990 [archaeon]